MKKRLLLYLALMVFSILLFTVAFTILKNTKFIAPLIVVISIYLFLGSLIKLCKMNDKLKNTVLCIIDLLFYLP